MGAVFRSLKPDQTLSGFWWVRVEELEVNFVEFSEHRSWSFQQFLSSRQCRFLGSAEHHEQLLLAFGLVILSVGLLSRLPLRKAQVHSCHTIVFAPID